MYDIGRAVKRPFTDIKALIIGIVLVVLFIIPLVNIVTMLLLVGYVLTCAKTASEGNFEMPVWGDWVGLLIKGIVAGIVGFVYMLPGTILFFLGPIIAMAAGDAGMLALLLMPLGWLLWIIAGYFLPIALTKYAIEGNFGSAFAFGEVIGKGLHVDYLITLIVAYIIGSIESIILGFPGMVQFYTAIGETYSKL